MFFSKDIHSFLREKAIERFYQVGLQDESLARSWPSLFRQQVISLDDQVFSQHLKTITSAPRLPFGDLSVTCLSLAAHPSLPAPLYSLLIQEAVYWLTHYPSPVYKRVHLPTLLAPDPRTSQADLLKGLSICTSIEEAGALYHDTLMSDPGARIRYLQLLIDSKNNFHPSLHFRSIHLFIKHAASQEKSQFLTILLGNPNLNETGLISRLLIK